MGRWFVLGEGHSSVGRQGIPLTSFDADVAAVRRAIAHAENDVILVGHSYAGALIGEAGNDPKIQRLVYIDAFAPDAGESAGTLFAQFEFAPLRAELRPDAEGFLKVTREGRMAMPNASMHKDDGAAPRQNDVRTTGQNLRVQPVAEAQCMEALTQLHLRLGIPSPNARHHF